MESVVTFLQDVVPQVFFYPLHFFKWSSEVNVMSVLFHVDVLQRHSIILTEFPENLKYKVSKQNPVICKLINNNKNSRKVIYQMLKWRFQNSWAGGKFDAVLHQLFF